MALRIVKTDPLGKTQLPSAVKHCRPIKDITITAIKSDVRTPRDIPSAHLLPLPSSFSAFLNNSFEHHLVN